MDKVKKAIEVFRNGGIVIFPTDTAIGIGCRIDNERSIKKLFRIRKRPQNKPMLALVDSIEMAQDYLLPISEEVKEKIIKPYWPGELTIILKCNPDKVLFPVRDKRNTLGVRFPKEQELLELIMGVGVPIVAPSANFTDEKTPFKFKDLNPELVRQADYVLNKKISLKKNLSTIIDCSVEPWKILREGAIKIQNSKFKIQNVILLLDTADNKKITVGLIINGRKDIQTRRIISNRAQIILPMIDRILKKHSLNLKDFSEIQINAGPGSFTGLRIGLTIANTLSFILKIPVNGKKVGEIILPIYS
jgi:L-threonylcarbamoyladenylate synthase